MTSTGQPWFRPHSKNPQSAFQNWFTALLKRVRRVHPDFRKLPFGSIRDLLPNILRQEYSDEVASICLQHGDPSEDDLLKCYANVPYRKLFKATQELEPRFKVFLDRLTPQED